MKAASARDLSGFIRGLQTLQLARHPCPVTSGTDQAYFLKEDDARQNPRERTDTKRDLQATDCWSVGPF
jgi:hypothetical protein